MKKIFISLMICILCFTSYLIGYNATEATTNLSLIKVLSGDNTTDWYDNANLNLNLIDGAFNDVLAYDTSPVLRGNLDISTFSIEGVDATEFAYLNGTTSDIQTQFGLRYLKTEIDTQAEVETIWGVSLANDGDCYLKTEIDSQGEMETIWNVTLSTDTEVTNALAAFVGSSNITTLGTIATGVWSGTALVVGKIPTAAVSDGDGANVPTADAVYDFCETTQAYLQNIVEDTTPQLGGDLNAQTNQIGFTQQTITYNVTTTTVDWGVGNKATVTLTGNIGTMAFTNPTTACNVLLKIVQDATGSRVVTAWDADIKWAGGTAPTLTTAANSIDIVSFYWDGTNYFGVASLAFATP